MASPHYILTMALLAVSCGCDPRAIGPADPASTERTDEVHWYPFSIGVIDRHYEGGLGHHGVVVGDGSYITIRDGESFLESTGGWYYQLGLQLPVDLTPGDLIHLSPASTDRHFEQVGDFYNVGFLKPNEFVAFRYGSPTGGYMACDDPDSFATIRILRVDREQLAFQLTLHASIPSVADIDLDREFDLPRDSVHGGYPRVAHGAGLAAEFEMDNFTLPAR